ncbi:MAG: YhfC family glutamic-type intramembrane protease [Bacteroidia bacterium]|nr:YhfC family glutamic-type intramembrane protease [Bacteroidia bacterium]
MILLLLFLALAPVSVLFTYVYLRDKHEREPLKYLIITFILGIATAVPVLVISYVLERLTGASDTSQSWIELGIYAFTVVALTEEGMKYLVLRWYNYPHEEFDEPYDGIMYGVAVSLGFAAIENVLYVFTSAGGEAVSTAIVRMFTALPAHATFGVLMGYFVGKAKFLENQASALGERLKGLAAAVTLHGLYDYFLFLGDAWLAGFAIVCLLIGLMLARHAMYLHTHRSPHIVKRDIPIFYDDSPE